MLTEKITVEESHLLLPILWEGDLRIHTSREYCKRTPFHKNILHGDTTVILSLQLLKKELKVNSLQQLSCRFLAPTYVGDRLHVEYEQPSQEAINFSTWNQDGVCVLEGNCRYVP